MDYELIVSDAALETVTKYRRDLLRGVAGMAMNAVSSADATEYWRIPIEGQRDAITATRLAALMIEHGVEVRLSADKKSFLIPTAQPYGRFVEEMLGIQRYPEVKPAPTSGILEPYDVAAWSLPLMMGVGADKVKLSQAERQTATLLQSVPWPKGGLAGEGKYYAVVDQQNNVFALINAAQKAGGEVFLQSAAGEVPKVVFAAHPQLAADAQKLHLELQSLAGLPKDAKPLKAVRIGLYKSYVPSLDEGWTRFLLEEYGFNLKNIENKEMKAGKLHDAYDVIILPDGSRDAIVDGRPGREGYFEELPPEYTGGIGKEGVRALKEFVDNGGTLITLAHAAEVLMGRDSGGGGGAGGDESRRGETSAGFNLPVRNILAGAGESRRGVSTSDFNIPGSLLRVYIDRNHPVGYGMPSEVPAFFDGAVAFQTTAPGPELQRSVIAWYPDDAKDILISGYAHGAERLERKAAAVSFIQGKGKIVMFGFRVQHRAQTEGTFQMLFNAICWGGM
jgi:hypothetical protein